MPRGHDEQARTPLRVTALRRAPDGLVLTWRATRARTMKSRQLIYVKMLDMAEYDQPLGFLLYQMMAALRPHVNAELRPLGANVTPQAMSLVLRALEDTGLIARPEAVSSGRSLPARLTRKGATLLKRAEKAVQVADAQLLDTLTPAERDELKRLLYVSSSRFLKDAASA